MSKNYEGLGVDPAFKERINKDVLEMGKDCKDHNVKTEDNEENLRQYIDEQKIIKVTNDEMDIPEEYKEKIYPLKAWLICYNFEYFEMMYIDKNGNIAEVKIGVKKLEPLRGGIDDALRKAGFKVEIINTRECPEYAWVLEQINKKQEKLNE